MGHSLAQLIASHPTQRLVATARDISKLRNTLSDDSDRIFFAQLDVNSSESIRKAFDSALAKFGRVDVVVNNAGYGLMGDAESFITTAEDLAKAQNIVQTNFWGTAQVSAHAVRVFRDENPKTGQIGGVVLNVTSIGGFAGFPGSAFYHASKFAVEGYTESLSKEMRPEWNSKFSLSTRSCATHVFFICQRLISRLAQSISLSSNPVALRQISPETAWFGCLRIPRILHQIRLRGC